MDAVSIAPGQAKSQGPQLSDVEAVRAAANVMPAAADTNIHPLSRSESTSLEEVRQLTTLEKVPVFAC